MAAWEQATRDQIRIVSKAKDDASCAAILDSSRAGGSIDHVDLTHSTCPIPVAALCATVGRGTEMIRWQGGNGWKASKGRR
jgi:hypothetical protein